ncbi:unnamed protein product [Larinioides sclopetarius]|uniref:Uncharacterized protein n=1 Tax=Larinioides sclopetarius TaxID=280406 RepID=A0AAV1ZS24_9ARAC
MAEGGATCTCNGAKKKSGVFRLFRFGKKKKKKICTDPSNCIKCIQKNINLEASQYTMDAYIEKERMMTAESRRKELSYVQLPQERKQMPVLDDSRDDAILLRGPLDPERRMVVASGSRDPCTAGVTVSRDPCMAAGAVSRDPCIAAATGVPDEEALLQMPLKYHSPHCNCAACKKKRYDDSLLAMDAQVILQNSLLQNTLSDTAGLVCVIL